MQCRRISCRNTPPETISVSDVTTEAQDFAVADYTLIQLTNLEEGGLYGIYPIERNSRASGTQKADNPSLITTNAGTRLFKAESDTAQFYGAEIGISNSGHVKILKYDDTNNAAINTVTDKPLYFDEVEQSYVYEKYSVVETSEFDKEIALLFYRLSGKGGARMSTDYGVIDTSTGSLSHDAKYRGVFDVTGKDTIEIFNQIRVEEGSEIVSEVLVQNPVSLFATENNTIKNKQLYEIKASDWTGNQPVVMELKLEQGVDIFDLFLSNSAIDIRYTNGYRHPYFFPLSWNEEENTVVIYIGEIDEDIIFDISANKELGEEQTIGTATLRKIKDDEKQPQVISVEPGRTEPIEIKADDFFTPVIFEGGTSIAGMNVLYECESEPEEYKALFVEGHTSGLGFSQYQLNDGENRDERMDSDIYNYLEYMVIRNPGQKEGRVNLTFSNSDSFKDVQRLKTGEPADFSLDQDYLYYFSENNVILEIELDENVVFSPQLVDELSNFSYTSSDLNLCFTPVHYDSDLKTLYVDAGKTTGPVEFFVRSWEENAEPRKIGTITAVEKELEDGLLTNADVSGLQQEKPVAVTVNVDMKNSPYKAYRVTWEGNQPPTEWKFDFSGPEGSFVRGRTYSLSGEYLGTLHASWKEPESGDMSGAVITIILFVNTQFSTEQEKTVLNLTISKPE